MKISKKIIFSTLAVAVAFSACKKSPYPDYEETETGLYYKFYSQDEKGAKPKAGDVASFKVIYKNNKDSVIFDSKNMSKGGAIENFPLGDSISGASFEEALTLMSVGDSASFIISADSFYFKTFKAQELPKFIEKGSMLVFDVKLEKFKSKEQVMKEQQKMMEEQKVMMELRKGEEPKTIAKYLADNKINAKPAASGLYYIEKTKGKGKKITVGDTVQVNYKGMFLDGNVFDSSERSPVPVEFPIGVGAVIKGWDEGIPMMNVGGKAELIIPSSIGYGEMGVQGVIPPFSPLKFEVEVVGVKSKK